MSMPYNGKFDEYAQLYSQLGQVTIMDLIRDFNFKKDENDRLKSDVNAIAENVNLMMQLMGHYSTHTLREAVNEKNISNLLDNKKALLKMDKMGNIWLNGVLENNPTKIGKEIIKIAQQYRENLPIEKMSEYLNIETEPEPDPFSDVPF